MSLLATPGYAGKVWQKKEKLAIPKRYALQASAINLPTQSRRVEQRNTLPRKIVQKC